MATGLGYQKRESKAEQAMDWGGALRGATTKIQTAKVAAEAQVEQAVSKYETAKKKIEQIDQGKHEGFQNWIQEQISHVTSRMYDEFQSLKKSRGRNDNEYRRKMANMNSSWDMLAKRAQNWNKHYEEVITAINQGKVSPFGIKMSENSSAISNIKDLDLTIDDDGNMMLDGVDENGDAVSMDLSTILSPENSYDQSLDKSKELNDMVSSLPTTKVDIGGGKFLESQAKHKDFNKQRLINADSQLTDSRAVAKWYAALNEGKTTLNGTQDAINKSVNKYFTSDLGQMELEAKKQELIAADPNLDDAVAKEEAMKILLGEQYMYQIKYGPINGVDQPDFNHSMKAPADMIITTKKINPTTGEVEEETVEIAKDEFVPIGQYQKDLTKAQLYEEQAVMVDHIETGGKKYNKGGSGGGSLTQQEEEDKAFYTTVADAARWNTQAYIDASGGKIKSIERAHNGEEGEDFRYIMRIRNKDKSVKDITYPVVEDPPGSGNVVMENGEPVLDHAKMEELLADHLQGGKPKTGTGRFRKGKKAYGTTPYQPVKATPTEAKRYYRVSKGAQGKKEMFAGKNAYGRFQKTVVNSKGKRVQESMNSDEAMKKMTIGNSTSSNLSSDITQYLRGFGRIKDDKITVKSNIPWSGEDNSLVKIKSPYTNGGELNMTILSNLKTDVGTKTKGNTKRMELAMAFYHARSAAKRDEIRKEMDAISPCIDKKQINSYGLEKPC